jgi:hypothetical protein
MFNRHSGFYTADIVVLGAVRAPREYCCLVMPVVEAKRATQINLEREYRTLKQDGEAHKPNKVWVELDRILRTTKVREDSFCEEYTILNRYTDQWAIFDGSFPARMEKMPRL